MGTRNMGVVLDGVTGRVEGRPQLVRSVPATRTRARVRVEPPTDAHVPPGEVVA